jgi:hypothetical protein
MVGSGSGIRDKNPGSAILGLGYFVKWFSMIEIVVRMKRKSMNFIQFVKFFLYLIISNRFGAGAVSAGAASCCGSGSIKMMKLLAASAPALQHWFNIIMFSLLL